MKIPIRIFNEDGIERFREYLGELKMGSKDGLPEGLLTSDEYSTENRGGIEVESRHFETRREIVLYLHIKIVQLSESNVFYNRGLSSWLSAFYFDSVCPPKNDGTRNPKADPRHIMSGGGEWGGYRRHLLASPIRLYEELGDLAEIYLVGPPNEFGDVFEQLSARQEIATSKGIIEAASTMYLEKDGKKIKKGLRGKPGDHRRFAKDIIPQFQMTYDLNSMTGEEILELLPEEFDIWKP